MFPCNVIAYEETGVSKVAIVDPILVLGVVKNHDLESIAIEARARLRQVINAMVR